MTATSSVALHTTWVLQVAAARVPSDTGSPRESLVMTGATWSPGGFGGSVGVDEGVGVGVGVGDGVCMGVGSGVSVGVG